MRYVLRTEERYYDFLTGEYRPMYVGIDYSSGTPHLVKYRPQAEIYSESEKEGILQQAFPETPLKKEFLDEGP